MTMKDKNKGEKISYIPGRSNLSVTVFVPSDCSNNCRFCTSKRSYSERKADVCSVIKSIKKFCKKDPLAEKVSSFVITGGEPLANLKILSLILEAIPARYKVYVNTTVPTNVYSEKKLAAFVNSSHIDALNISRHTSSIKKDRAMFSKNIASDEFVGMLIKPVKINSVTREGDDFVGKIKRWEKYRNASLSFRADYRRINSQNLRTLDDPVVTSLMNVKHAKHVSHGGCDVCFDVTFRRKNFYFSYHRGLEHSSLPLGTDGSTIIVNDIIIYQDGTLSYDWL